MSVQWTSTQVSLPFPTGRALVRGCRSGAFDAGGEDQRAEDHVSAGGHRRALLQPPSAPQHPGEPPLPQQHRAHHQPLHHPVAQRRGLLPRVRKDRCNLVTSFSPGISMRFWGTRSSPLLNPDVWAGRLHITLALNQSTVC